MRKLYDTIMSKEESKYYTPEIEEFHVGFEFESHTMSSGGVWMPDGEVIPPVPVWNKELFNEKHLDRFNCAYDFKAVLEDERIRIKHLDRYDIESLGWEYQPDRDNLELFYDKEKGAHSIIHNKINDWVLITLRNKIRKEDHTAFAGTVKNKSELKRLLQWIM